VRCNAPPARLPGRLGSPAPRLTRAPPQWLHLLELQAHQQLPQVVLERLNTRMVNSFCGLLPEIGRVWCSIDNVLYIWRYDRECAPRCAPAGTRRPRAALSGARRHV
jgi:hypothetical protein